MESAQCLSSELAACFQIIAIPNRIPDSQVWRHRPNNPVFITFNLAKSQFQPSWHFIILRYCPCDPHDQNLLNLTLPRSNYKEITAVMPNFRNRIFIGNIYLSESRKSF